MVPTACSSHDAMTPAPARHRLIRVWLYAVAALVFAMVMVGGATRLTGSGLSIVEWKPVTGTIPPLSQAQWTAEFEKYKTIPQYQQINRGMSVDEFKTIYWWEWTHRFLGRLIGVAFLLPFLFFLWRGWIEPDLRGRLWVIFALGALQGAVGWWMVASGLADRTSVSQYRLSFHLTLACLIYAALIWTARRLATRPPHDAPMHVRVGVAALVALTFVQIYLGALVAGFHAGLTYNTWPLIDGRLLPGLSELFLLEPAWRNLFENALTIQFNHRIIAYLLWLAALSHAVAVARTYRRALAAAVTLACAITIQAALGIITLLYQAPMGWALVHQAFALVVLTLGVLHAERLSPRPQPEVRAAAPKLAVGRSNPSR
jgi:cytochrome c oxidase assembly protein subunit 15